MNSWILVSYVVLVPKSVFQLPTNPFLPSFPPVGDDPSSLLTISSSSYSKKKRDEMGGWDRGSCERRGSQVKRRRVGSIGVRKSAIILILYYPLVRTKYQTKFSVPTYGSQTKQPCWFFLLSAVCCLVYMYL